MGSSVRPNRQVSIEAESELVPLELRMMVAKLKFSHLDLNLLLNTY
jgi:hypothetical protein